MRMKATLPILAILVSIAACDSGSLTLASCCSNGTVDEDTTTGSLRIVNGFTGAVDVLVDGTVAIDSLAAGSIALASSRMGSHTLQLRPVAGGASASRAITRSDTATQTLVAIRTASGAVSSLFLEDTSEVVAAGTTKVRVLHFAPNAGSLQVYRTQPDSQTPAQWRSPFTYQDSITADNARFHQGTPGTWEIRAWQTPANSTGWATAPAVLLLNLQSGEKRTVIILDQPTGGVRLEWY